MNTLIKTSKVCVVGLGYIGLPTASVLASRGFEVHGVDVNKNAVELINEGKIHIYEPDLDILVKKVVQENHLKASLEPTEADIFILAVPTPFGENHVPDISYVETATKSILPYLKNGNIVILESTSPIGTTERISQIIKEGRRDLKIYDEEKYEENQVYIAHCPERVLPGKIMAEIVENDRIIGGINPQSTQKTVEFYRYFVKGEILETNARTAEMAKLTENSFRDVNIAFANELSVICDEQNINVWELIDLANHHPRVNILKPGVGVGGHCIAVDPWFIVDASPSKSRLIRTAREVNNYKPHYVVEKIIEHLNGNDNLSVSCFGLAFKPDVDDLRESPAIEIIELLSTKINNPLYVVEPYVSNLPERLSGKVVQLSYKEALEKSDLCVILVGHKLFTHLTDENTNLKIIDFTGIYR